MLKENRYLWYGSSVEEVYCRVGGMPEHWEPEEKDDPTQPKPKDPNAPDIPSMDVQQTPENTQGDTAADP